MARVYLAFLLLCVLLPLQALAQAPVSPPPLPAPGAREEAPPVPGGAVEKPQGEIIPRDWETSASVGRPGRVVLGSLGGLLLGLVGTVPGIFLVAEGFDCDGCGNDSSIVLGGLVGIAGMSAGTALGVKLAGSLFGGEGRYLHTLLGAVLGAGAGIFAALAMSETDGLWAIPLITSTVLGAIIGSEVSHSNEFESRAAGTGVTMLPSVSVRPSGAVVAGLVGRF